MAIERTLSSPDKIAPYAADRSRRVLIVRIGAMGDVLHAMPAVSALRQLHPDWFIGWVIEPSWSGLLQSSTGYDQTSRPRAQSEGNPLVDRLHSMPAKAWKRRPHALSTWKEINTMRRELRSCEYDLCVDMQGSLKSAIAGRMASAQIFAGPSNPREAPARWLYNQQVTTSAEHVVQQGCELLGAAIGEPLTPAAISLPVDARAEAWCDRLLDQTTSVRDRFAFLAPTAGWGAKQWPSQRFGAVAAALGRAGFRSLVNETPGHRFADAVVDASEGFATSVPCSVEQMIALVRRAGIVIAGDTGPLHLAAALNRPLVGLYGPTDPARNGPYMANPARARVLRHASSQTDHSRHAQTETGMLQIPVEEVVEAALELLHREQDSAGDRIR